MRQIMHSRNNTGLDYASSSDIIARMTEEICKLAVQDDGYSLLYVPSARMTRAGDIYALDYAFS